jgi:hypothetical protein
MAGTTYFFEFNSSPALAMVDGFYPNADAIQATCTYKCAVDNQLRIYHNYNTYEGSFIQDKVISGCSPCIQYKFAYNESNLRAYIEQDKEFAYLNSGVLFGNDHVGQSDSAYLGIHNGQIHTSSVSAVARR